MICDQSIIWTAASPSHYLALSTRTHAGIVMRLTAAQPNDLIWRRIESLGQFRTMLSLVFMSQWLLHRVLGWLRTTCSTPAFNFTIVTVASTVERQSLDNKWK